MGLGGLDVKASASNGRGACFNSYNKTIKTNFSFLPVTISHNQSQLHSKSSYPLQVFLVLVLVLSTLKKKPILLLSFSKSLLRDFFGLPLLLPPCGFLDRACLVMVSSCFLILVQFSLVVRLSSLPIGHIHCCSDFSLSMSVNV
jgi:hypothetical protein